MGRAIQLFGFSLAVGLLMSVFILVPGIFRYAFSLGALFVGIQFFKRFEGKGARIGFILLAIVFSLFIPSIYAAMAYQLGWPLDPSFLKQIEEK